MELLKDSYRVCFFLNIMFCYFEIKWKIYIFILYGYLKYKILFYLLY